MAKVDLMFCTDCRTLLAIDSATREGLPRNVAGKQNPLRHRHVAGHLLCAGLLERVSAKTLKGWIS